MSDRPNVKDALKAHRESRSSRLDELHSQRRQVEEISEELPHVHAELRREHSELNHEIAFLEGRNVTMPDGERTQRTPEESVPEAEEDEDEDEPEPEPDPTPAEEPREEPEVAHHATEVSPPSAEPAAENERPYLQRRWDEASESERRLIGALAALAMFFISWALLSGLATIMPEPVETTSRGIASVAEFIATLAVFVMAGILAVMTYRTISNSNPEGR